MRVTQDLSHIRLSNRRNVHRSSAVMAHNTSPTGDEDGCEGPFLSHVGSETVPVAPNALMEDLTQGVAGFS